jgi:shikimate dehydrogenase
MTEMFLIGRHISHSLSPPMWNHLFDRTGRNIHYSLRDVESAQLSGVLGELRAGSVLAANITMPYKGWAASIADTTTEDVTVTGAANLLQPGESGLHAANTDVTGARRLLRDGAPYRRVLVVGAGATAAAMVHALSDLAQVIEITNRTTERAARLAAARPAKLPTIDVVAWEDRDRRVAEADLVVNTVPMSDELPFELSRLPLDSRLYDVVYRREPTLLQRLAGEAGVRQADGLAHLAAQAIEMLEPLGIEIGAATLLIEGLEDATGRRVTAWGEPLV